MFTFITGRHLERIRRWLFIMLLAIAPFSFVPSFSLPTAGFVSFRIGLYQLLVIVFVLSMIPVIWRAKLLLIKDYWVSVPIIMLGLIVISSPFRSLDYRRSALLSISILLLVSVIISGLAFGGQFLTQKLQERAAKLIGFTGILVGLFATAQLIVNTYTTKGLGLCAKCSADVFGFPRVSGFAAEPLFLASSLLPPFILFAASYVTSQKSKQALLSFGFMTFVLTLTLSRGGYIAASAGIVSLVVSLGIKKQLAWKRAGLLIGTAVIAVALGFGALVTSATIRLHKTNPSIARDTIRTIVEHVSNGYIKLPKPLPAASPAPSTPTTSSVTVTPEAVAQVEPNPQPAFQSPGLIAASGQERESAAQLGIKWWRKDVVTLLFGLGSGNLGSFAHAQDASIPLSLTIYIQYIFILVELGVIGLVSFVWISILSIKRALRAINTKASVMQLSIASILVAFVVQYFFFGSYINTIYIWLYTGLGLSIVGSNKKKTHKS